MDSEIASGPDIQRFLEDAVKATAEFARNQTVRYLIQTPNSASPEHSDVDSRVNLRPSLFAGLASCYNSGRRTTIVGLRPKKKVIQTSGWKTAPLILSSEIGEKLGSTAITYNLIVFLTTSMNMSLVKAVSISSASFGASSLATLPGIILADAYLARVHTVAAGSIFYLGGLAILTLVGMRHELKPTPCGQSGCSEASPLQTFIVLLSLTLQAIGSGGIRPCAALSGADQFDETNPGQQNQIQNFMIWYKACMAFTMMAATTAVICMQTKIGWGWGSLFLSIIMGLSLAALLIGIPFYRIVHVNGSPVTSLVQVLVAAIRKRKLSLQESPNHLYQGKTQDLDDALLHTENMRWLDKAAVVEYRRKDEIDQSNRWMLCSVQQVEELKKVLRLAPVWLCSSVSAIVYIQTFTIMTEQAVAMNRNLGKHITVPAGSMGAFSILTFFLFVLLYDAYLVKVFRKLTGQTMGLTCLQRIGVGIFIGILTMGTAALVETKRRYLVNRHQTQEMSVFELVPQFLLAGLGASFVVTGLLDFFKDETPRRLQGMGQSVVWAALGTGGILNATLVSILQPLTKAPTRGWLDDNINLGRVDYFYCSLAVLGALVFFVYVFIAMSYTYIVKTDLDQGHINLDKTGANPINDSL